MMMMMLNDHDDDDDACDDDDDDDDIVMCLCAAPWGQAKRCLSGSVLKLGLQNTTSVKHEETVKPKTKPGGNCKVGSCSHLVHVGPCVHQLNGNAPAIEQKMWHCQSAKGDER